MRSVYIDSLLVHILFSGALAVTIDKGAKYKFSGASAIPERKEHSIQGPTTTLLHQCERQRDQLPCFSPHRGHQPPATPDGLQPGP